MKLDFKLYWLSKQNLNTILETIEPIRTDGMTWAVVEMLRVIAVLLVILIQTLREKS